MKNSSDNPVTLYRDGAHRRPEITDVWIDEARFGGQSMRPENERNLPSYYLEWLDQERSAGRNPAVGSIIFHGIV